MEEIKNKIEEFKNTFSQTESKTLALMLLVLSIIFDLAFFHKWWGWGLWLCVFIFQIFFLFIAYKFLNLDNKLTKTQVFLSFSSIFVSFWFVIFTNKTLIFDNLILLFILNLTILLNFQKLNLNSWFNLIWLKKIFLLIGESIDNILFSYNEIRKTFGNKIPLSKDIKSACIWGILLLWILFFIIPLLVSADKVFADYVRWFFNFFANLNILFWDLFTRFIVIFLALLVMFSMFLTLPVWKLIRLKSQVKINKSFDQIIINMVLFWLNIVYVLFVFVQFKYVFFGNHELFRALDIPYSSYLHEWFYQLIFIAIFNFLLYNIFLKWSIIKGKINNITKWGLLILLISTIIICFSALTRILLYIDAYSLSFLRFFVVYIIWLIFIAYFLWVYKLFKLNFEMNKVFVIIALSSFILVSYCNVDSCVAQFNINKWWKWFDSGYILRLSDDAIDEKLIILDRIISEKYYKVEYDLDKVYYPKINSLYNFNYYNFRGQEFFDKLNESK